MGFFDSFNELMAAATPWATVEAEAPEKPEEKDDGSEVCSFGPACCCDLLLKRRNGGWRTVRAQASLGS